MRSSLDEKFMQKAIQLAEKGKGNVSPNPLVGAVIVKSGKIVSTGYHQKVGKAHAEVNALRKAGSRTKGATMYVNLEPCSQYGRTPPCVDAIVKAGVKKVIVGMKDPNLNVNGKGIKKLKKNKIKVEIFSKNHEIEKLNEIYLKNIRKKLPFVLLKVAVSLDGKIALKKGKRIILSGKESQKKVHELRGELDAILVGVNTVIRDNPKLTARLKGKKNPIRVILDSHLRIPLNSKLLKENGITTIACVKKAKKNKIKSLQKNGVFVLVTKEKNKRVDLRDLIKKLYNLGVTSIMIEGGTKTIASALHEKIVDKVILAVCPVIIGKKGLDLIDDKNLEKAIYFENLRDAKIEKCGRDMLIEGYLK